MQGYQLSYILALITLDVVSRPGFADAELKPISIATEAALAVCESLNLFKNISHSKRNFDMNKKNKRNSGYMPVIAIENLAGVATAPTKEFEGKVAAFIADVLDKLPGTFTASDFSTNYSDSMYDSSIIGLYEDTAELMIQDADNKTMAMISLQSDKDGEYSLADDADIQYYNTEIASNSNEVNNPEPGEEALYPIVATEGYDPSEGFIAIAGKVSDWLKENHECFDMDEFNADISAKLEDEFDISARIVDDEDGLELRFVDDEAENGATIALTKNEDGKYCVGSVSEYWQPGTESEVGDNVCLKDASGDCIVTGKIEALGIFGDLKDVIKDEDEQGFGLMTDAGIDDDTQVYKIDGDWYYLGDGMTIEPVEGELATEGEVLDDIEKGMNIQVIEGEETLDEGVCQECGTLGDYRELIAQEDEDAQAFLDANDCDDNTPVAKVNDKWYIGAEGCGFKPCVEGCKESIDAVQQTDGNQNNPLPTDKNYMPSGETKTEELEMAEVLDDEDEAHKQNQEQVAGQVAEVIEEPMAEVVDEDPDEQKKPKGETKDERQEAEDANKNELAEEAQRIFAMPNSKFAGNYAVEHMPAMYKHIWSGLTDNAKSVVAKKAEKAQIATESQNLKFWSELNFVAIERACLTTAKSVEAALESLQVEDPRTKFLKSLGQGVKL
jgi:hypothetical protein